MAYTGPDGEFRQFLPNLSCDRFRHMRQQKAHEYAAAFKQKRDPPWLYALWQHWRNLYREPFRGLTNDGNLRTNLFLLQDEGVPVAKIANVANALLEMLTPIQHEQTLFHIDSPEWRSWSNPEFLLSDKGIRLDEVKVEVKDAVLKVLELTLSPEGYRKAVDAMRINGFLGSLVQASTICNELSYNFAIFGNPSDLQPWGYSFYGHHLCLNIFLYRSQIVISPWFTGAEPNEIDEGMYKGTSILQREQNLGLELMQTLPQDLQAAAQVYTSMHDTMMPPGRWNRDDQRHLCGAYQDNRVVPYEGVVVANMPTKHIELVEQILSEFLLYLPSKARNLRLSQVRDFFAETYFCWIGGLGDNDAFYYRIQSPVIVVEFDHHSGVFLSNAEPAKFHIHTLLRTPNAGDYGKALIPLIQGEEQVFVWHHDDEHKAKAKSEGYQPA